MNESSLKAFFGVVARPRTWLNILFQWLAFPLGLFYFICLVTGLSLGIGLVIIWVGIPILLIVTGSWWLFGAFAVFWFVRMVRVDLEDASVGKMTASADDQQSSREGSA